jgi:hypothetical protein
MMTAVEPSLMGERLRLPKWLMMNSRLPKRMVSPKEKTSLDGCSLSAATVSADMGTIGPSRGKAGYKFPFLVCQLSVFFALERYRVVTIMCSYSEVVCEIQSTL